MRTPAEVYVTSKRKYDRNPEQLDYDTMGSRKVNARGKINWQSEGYFLSTSLSGWNVGVQSHNHQLNVWFGRLLLGQIDPSSASFLRADIRPQKPEETNDNYQNDP